MNQGENREKVKMGKWGGGKLLTSCCPTGGKLKARRAWGVVAVAL